MKYSSKLIPVYEDQIVKIWRGPETNNKLASQGKRVSANHPWTEDERKLWISIVLQSGIPAAKMTIYFREKYQLSLEEAYNKVKKGRGKIFYKWDMNRQSG